MDFINNEDDMGMLYTYRASFYSTGPTPFDAWINFYENHRLLYPVNFDKSPELSEGGTFKQSFIHVTKL
jgi:hypothetical protein